MVMTEFLPRTAISTPAFEDSFQSTLILTFRKSLHCPIENRIIGLFCYWLCFKTVIKASEYWAKRLKVELFSFPMREMYNRHCNANFCPTFRQWGSLLDKTFFNQGICWVPLLNHFKLWAQIPGFHLFWWRLMSLGLLAVSGLQVWSHAHSVGEKRLSKISMFILLYWRHEVSRGWVSDMWYQPRWKWWELMALSIYRDWLLHLCRWCLTHVSEVHLNFYLLQMTVPALSSA